MKPTSPEDHPEQRARSHTSWQDELTALLAQIDAAHTPDAEAHVLATIAALDPDLQQFLIEQLAEQETSEAATFLAALAAHPVTRATARGQARAALDALAARGVSPPQTAEESFFTGWVQRGRECGEQIMMLAWRMPEDRLEALVFLLDWRGDGLKDFYRTREMNDAEWRELVEHNGQKGAPLTEISLAEGRALLEAALAEGRRFSRPVPREYRLSQALIRRRVLDATALPAASRDFITPELDPAAVVAAYVRALHHRDYLLAWALLAPEHPQRGAETTAAAGVDALRQTHKHRPRPRPETVTTLEDGAAQDATATVLAAGEEEYVETSGRKVRQPVRERYSLRRTAAGWRITGSERSSNAGAG
jgi:hypothetical protein